MKKLSRWAEEMMDKKFPKGIRLREFTPPTW